MFGDIAQKVKNWLMPGSSFNYNQSNNTLDVSNLRVATLATLNTLNVGSINASGIYTNSAQPAFYALRKTSVTNATGDGTVYQIAFNEKQFDIHSDFNISTGLFTAPKTGLYLFNLGVTLSNLTASFTTAQGGLIISGTSAGTYYLYDNRIGTIRDAANQVIMSGSVLVHMTAGDTAQSNIMASGSTKTVTVVGVTIASGSGTQTFMSGYLVG